MMNGAMRRRADVAVLPDIGIKDRVNGVATPGLRNQKGRNNDELDPCHDLDRTKVVQIADRALGHPP